jgi:hypothetical protein
MNARGHLSSETIDLLMLSGLDAEQTNVAKAHIDICERCRTRWRELNEDKERFVQYVYPRTVGAITSRVVATSWLDRLRIFGPWKIFGPALGVGVAALVAVLVVGNGGGGGTQSEDEVYVGVKGGKASGGGGGKLSPDLGLKGDSRIDFEVVAQRKDEGQFPVKEGTVLKPGDKIRFVVTAGGAKYVMIGSKDGAGNFTVFHPYGGETSASLERGQHELPGSIELDEVTGKEKLFAIFSAEPLKADDVKAMVEKAGPEPKDTKVISLEYVKGAK